MKKNHSGIYIYSLILLATTGMTSCKKTKPVENIEFPVSVAAPQVQTIILTDEYPGYLQALNTVNLVARVSGSLNQVLYMPGERVNKGKPLFVIEPTTYKDNVFQAGAAPSEAQATLEYDQATYARTVEAAKANAVSEVQVIQTKANYAQS